MDIKNKPDEQYWLHILSTKVAIIDAGSPFLPSHCVVQAGLELAVPVSASQGHVLRAAITPSLPSFSKA